MTRVALVDAQLQELVSANPPLLASLSTPAVDYAGHVQPASIDLPLGHELWLVRDKVIPFKRRVRDVAKEMVLERIDVTTKEPVVLLRGQTYLWLVARVELPAGYVASLSPKSSIGRVDVMVRGIFDECGLYDYLAPNSRGELWMEISPRSFNVKAKPGQAMSQMMIFEEALSNAYTPSDLLSGRTFGPIVYKQNGDVVETPEVHDGSLVLSIGLTPPPPDATHKRVKLSEETPAPHQAFLVGWEAVPTSEPVDLTQINQHLPRRFFRPLRVVSEEAESVVAARSLWVEEGSSLFSKSVIPSARITLEKDKFYILCTKERVSVPTRLAAEMIPFSHNIGELRAHYAGFFDPGFGYGRRGEINGTVAVLEVRPHETITVYDGQPICLMKFFVNKCEPNVAYGFAGNNYMHQTGPKLSKYFKEAPV